MKKDKMKKVIMLSMLVVLVVLMTGCQSNVDASGNTLPERIISLSTPWKDMMNESFFTALFVYPLAQCVNWIGKMFNSPALGVILTTILYNILTLGLSIKSTVQTQKLQMIQPQQLAIQEKYAGRTDEAAKMAQAQELQALMNKHHINPMSTLITPLLTFPILISMFYAVQRAEIVCKGHFAGIELSTTPLTAIKNITTQWPIVVIFVLMFLCQFLQTKVPQWLASYQRKHSKNYRKYKDNGNTANSQQNRMMLVMIVMVGFIGLRWPAAMSLYWLVNSVVGIVKTVFIQWRYIDNE